MILTFTDWTLRNKVPQYRIFEVIFTFKWLQSDQFHPEKGYWWFTQLNVIHCFSSWSCVNRNNDRTCSFGFKSGNDVIWVWIVNVRLVYDGYAWMKFTRQSFAKNEIGLKNQKDSTDDIWAVCFDQSSLFHIDLDINLVIIT